MKIEALNWEDLRIFERLAHYGSLSRAARHIGVSQPTLSRQLQRLEREVGAPLVKRHIHGLTLTDQGREVLSLAKDMRERFEAFSGAQADETEAQKGTLKGNVRITASGLMSCFVLPQLLVDLQREAPEIRVDLLASDRAESLIFRDADIAIRFFESTQGEVISKPLGSLGIGCYAAKSYVRAHGAPRGASELAAHRLVGFDQRDEILQGFAQMGLDAARDWFSLRTDSDAANWALVCEGAGIGFTQRNIGDCEPRVERVLRDVELPRAPIWLAASESLRFVPHLRFVWDFLEARLREITAGD